MTIMKSCGFLRPNLGLVFSLDGIYRIHRTTCLKILKSCSSVLKPSLDANAPCLPAATVCTHLSRLPIALSCRGPAIQSRGVVKTVAASGSGL
jgi:hypothetical protein